MAGIGFPLRKMLDQGTLTSFGRAFGYAGILGAGPWVLSILGVLLVGVLSARVVTPPAHVEDFQTTVTWLIAASLIFTGFTQLAYTRFVSDRLFERRDDLVLPTFNGLLLATLAIGALGSGLAVLFLFDGVSLWYRLWFIQGFVALSGVWIATILLAGLREYRAVLWLYLVGYALVVTLALLLRPFGLDGLLAGFTLGQTVLLFGMIRIVWIRYPSKQFHGREFFGSRTFWILAAVGFFYNAGVWADKFVFWFAEETGHLELGPLRASVIYDLPIFLSYLVIVPGMAVFLLRIETDFVEYYDRFYDAVRDGGRLKEIEAMRNEMTLAARQGIFDIVKVQSAVALLAIVSAPHLLSLVGMSELHIPLFNVDVVAVSLQLVLMALLNVLFYLDARREAAWITGVFLVSNVILSIATIELGPPWYGYGFAFANLISVAMGFAWLNRRLDRIEFETFMMR